MVKYNYAKKGSTVLGRIKIRGHKAPITAEHWNKASTAKSEENNDPTDVWWDTENNLVPEDMEPEEVYDRIVVGLRKRGYKGHVTLRTVYAGFSEHITREFEATLKSQDIHCTNMGYVDVRLAPKDAADEEIKTQIGAFVSENPAPRNIMIISGDHGFKKKLQDVNGENYKTLAAFRNRAAAEDKMNVVVYDSWFWRMLLGLPETITKNSKKRILPLKKF